MLRMADTAMNAYCEGYLAAQASNTWLSRDVYRNSPKSPYRGYEPAFQAWLMGVLDYVEDRAAPPPRRPEFA